MNWSWIIPLPYRLLIIVIFLFLLGSSKFGSSGSSFYSSCSSCSIKFFAWLLLFKRSNLFYSLFRINRGSILIFFLFLPRIVIISRLFIFSIFYFILTILWIAIFIFLFLEGIFLSFLSLLFVFLCARGTGIVCVHMNVESRSQGGMSVMAPHLASQDRVSHWA